MSRLRRGRGRGRRKEAFEGKDLEVRIIGEKRGGRRKKGAVLWQQRERSPLREGVSNERREKKGR